MCPYKDLYMNDHRNFICNSQKMKMKTTQMPINERMHKQIVVFHGGGEQQQPW